jgi:hypothetical protein
MTAYFMVQILAEQSGVLSVDKKLAPGDRFDDLTVRASTGTIHRQFKRSENAVREMHRADLTSNDYSLKIDDLVLMHTQVNYSGECRLCATWLPSSDPTLAPYLEQADRKGSFPGHPSQLFKLKSDAIWPDGDKPVWLPLKNANGFDRQSFLDFANRFVIELACPQASMDFQHPGDLERLILALLNDKIGIGRYPNHNLDPIAVADRLAWRASIARSQQEELTLAEIEQAINLRKDFGREAQQFPVDHSTFVHRESYVTMLRQRVEEHQKTVLVGPPGSGKSWTLDKLGEVLKGEGHLVARHYCYLSPGDERVERRVTTNALFANLMAELVDALPSLRSKPRRIYSAGIEELSDMLPEAVQASRTGAVFLIIDGLDHIARVLSDSRTIAQEETGIIDELSVLPLPDGVHLILGSQPGDHLDPFTKAEATVVTVPGWTRNDISSLVHLLGIPEAMKSAGFSDQEDTFIAALASRADGNPLYATYLSKELLMTLRSGSAVAPTSFLEGLPSLGGDLANYYRHLLRTSDNVGGMVAHLLAATDFGITSHELETILHPAPKYLIAPALNHLSPVTIQVAAQGGVRIYHESFRRFILDELTRKAIPISEVLSPLISWLAARDFYADAKAYRFLLSSLRRAGREDEISPKIGHDFVAVSVAAGHPYRAISSNLEIAASVAALAVDLPALARYAQLRWALDTCFERLSLDEYGQTYVELFGATALAERLLFDGRPTWSRTGGLRICSLCDAAGAVPPWREYLALEKDNDSSRQSESRDDSEAEFHGMVRLEGAEALFPRVAKFLNANPTASEHYVRSIVRRMGQARGIRILAKLGQRVRKHPQWLMLICEEAASPEYVSEPRITAKLATSALPFCDTPLKALTAVKLGVDPKQINPDCANPTALNVWDNSARFDEEGAGSMRQWVAAVTLAAMTISDRLDEVSTQVQGEGWYREWLRYVVSLARAETLANSDTQAAESLILSAFEALAADTDPFKGKPRACDLFPLHGIIQDTLARGLHLVHTKDAWQTAAAYLVQVARGTTTSLQQSQGGPLTSDTLAALVLAHVTDAELQHEVVALIEQERAKAEKDGELYDVHATHEMLLARALKATGRVEEARKRWENATQYLCAYGMRKETSIFEIIEPIPFLAKEDTMRARTLLAKSQTLTDAVLEHTDLKSTRHAPNTWFRSVYKTDPLGASLLLGDSMVRHGGKVSWILERALGEVAATTSEECDPRLAAFLMASLPYGTEDENFQARIQVIERLILIDCNVGGLLLRNLAAQVQGDAPSPAPSAYTEVEALAGRHGISLPAWSYPWEETERHDAPDSQSLEAGIEDAFGSTALFSSDATPLQIISWIRANKKYPTTNTTYERFVAALLPRLLEFSSNDKTEEAVRILRFMAREVYSAYGNSPLALIAERLAKADCTDLAAVSWALAYARGRDGWHLMGGLQHSAWMKNAIACSSDLAWRTLAVEVEHLLSENSFYGVAQHLIEICAICERPEYAFDAWEEAYLVVFHRLPNEGANFPGVFTPYTALDLPKWTASEVTFWLLVAQVSHPELKRKTAALAGCAEVFRAASAVALPGLRRMLNADSPVSSILSVLQAVWLEEGEPYEITLGLEDELRTLSNCEHFGIKWTAANLLFRATESIHLLINSDEAVETSNVDAGVLGELDWGDRIQILESKWPAFPGLLHARFEQVWKGASSHVERAQSRHRAASKRNIRDTPETPFLFWEIEIFDCVFHEIASRLTEFLIEAGQWRSGIEQELLPYVVPNVLAHLAGWYSRAPRPDIPLPSAQVRASTLEFPIVQAGDYSGWVCVGRYEEELLLASGVLPDAIGHIAAVSGVMSGDPDSTEGYLPLGIGDVSSWFTYFASDGQSPRQFKGPLCGLNIVRDTLGVRYILALHPRLIADSGLMPSDAICYELVDEQERKVAVLRTWSVRPLGNDIDGEYTRLQGCEMLVRPDVFEHMQMRMIMPLCWYTVVTRHENG